MEYVNGGDIRDKGEKEVKSQTVKDLICQADIGHLYSEGNGGVFQWNAS